MATLKAKVPDLATWIGRQADSAERARDFFLLLLSLLVVGVVVVVVVEIIIIIVVVVVVQCMIV